MVVSHPEKSSELASRGACMVVSHPRDRPVAYAARSVVYWCTFMQPTAAYYMQCTFEQRIVFGVRGVAQSFEGRDHLLVLVASD